MVKTALGTVVLLARICFITARIGTQPEMRQMVLADEIIPEEFSWQLRVTTQHKDATFSVCSGAIISQTHGLTTAECVSNYAFIILEAGLEAPHTSNACLNFSSTAILHNSWHPDQTAHNIAVLEFDRSLENDNYVSPIALPTNNRNRYESQEAFVSGYRLEYAEQEVTNSILKFTKVRILANEDCASKIENGAIYSCHLN